MRRPGSRAGSAAPPSGHGACWLLGCAARLSSLPWLAALASRRRADLPRRRPPPRRSACPKVTARPRRRPGGHRAERRRPRTTPSSPASSDGPRSEILAADEGSAWEAALAEEPPPQRRVPESRLDEICRALADFADIKTPWTLGHSSGVAELAEAAGWRLGLPPEEVAGLRRAALVHDLGRVGIPNAIWERPGPLASDERERVRLHAYLTERVLAHAPALAPLGATAALHHERLDGSGYHRACGAASLPIPARALAAADVYHALTEPRPHRPARPPAEAAAVLRAEVTAGRLDAEAARAVLDAAGQRDVRIERPRPAGLTEREVEVLRLLTRGNTNRAIARELSISVKTVGHHVEHVYEKIGCSTRASASLFAAEHDLV